MFNLEKRKCISKSLLGFSFKSIAYILFDIHRLKCVQPMQPELKKPGIYFDDQLSTLMKQTWEKNYRKK